jgi:hypothetical protein
VRTAVDSEARGASRPAVAFHFTAVDACPALLASAVKAVIMTNESGPSEEGAKGWSTSAQEQDAALKKLAAGEGDRLELAAVLRQLPELLDLHPQLPDTDHVRIVRGLAQLSNAKAFALAESGRVPINQAAFVGDYAQRRFVHDYPLQVCEDFQMSAMSRLAESQPASAEYAVDLVNEVATGILNEQKAEQLRLDCNYIWKETFWSVWHVLSWIAFRDVARLCEIKDENSLMAVSLYSATIYKASLKEAKPEYLLLGALKNDDLKAIKQGAELPDIYWADKYRVDRDVQFRQANVRRCWPGSGKALASQPEIASFAQAQQTDYRRAALLRYKDRLEQGAEIHTELEKAHFAQGSEAQGGPSPQTPGPIAAALDLWRDWNAADLTDLSEVAAARHAALKIALTFEREAALRDLETGKCSTLATARIFRSAPHVLDMLPDTPLLSKVQALVRMLNAPQEWDGYIQDAYWTKGQAVLWIAMGDPWTVDQISTKSGRHGETWEQVKMADLIDKLNLPREHLEEASEKLWQRCLDGRMTAFDGKIAPLPRSSGAILRSCWMVKMYPTSCIAITAERRPSCQLIVMSYLSGLGCCGSFRQKDGQKIKTWLRRYPAQRRIRLVETCRRSMVFGKYRSTLTTYLCLKQHTGSLQKAVRSVFILNTGTPRGVRSRLRGEKMN